jgi:small subunit ribosomal protein S4
MNQPITRTPPAGPARPTRTRRRPRSRYGIQLQEKQLLKSMYGVRDNQLKRYYHKARQAHGETGPNLIVLLERRLDNAIFRAGLAQTRRQARQMATHRFFTVNDRPVDIPSYPLKPNDVIAVRGGKRDASYFTTFEKRMQNARPPSWLAISPKTYSFTVSGLPSFPEANIGVDVRAVVEYFAR